MFNWGKVITRDFFCGEEIVEYHPWKREGNTVLKGHANDEEKLFHVGIESFPTFFHAVIAIMVIKTLGPNNSNVVYAIGRILKLEESSE